MSTSNTTLLTHSHTIYSAKKKSKKAQVKEVVFDEDARREYLTGFRKRNLLKKEIKQKNAKERNRLEKLELRKEHRRELAERAAQNVKDVESALGAIPDVSNFAIASTSQEKPEEEELEFENEEQFATVTVIEDFTTESVAHPTPVTRHTSSEPTDQTPFTPNSKGEKTRVRIKDALNVKVKTRPKTKPFRYETKAGRKAERMKQRARRTEKAERAGGKQKSKKKR